MLRACIVNYMTDEADIRTIVDEVLDAGNYLLSLRKSIKEEDDNVLSQHFRDHRQYSPG